MTMIEGHHVIEPPSNVTEWDVDPYDAEILRQPNAYYAELRAKGPLVYIPKYSALAVGRYQETKEIFSDWRRFVSSRGVGLNDFKHGDPWRPPSIILEVDPPEHTRTRKVMARALSPNAVVLYKDMFRQCADALVDDLLDKRHFDAVSDLSEVFPTTVFPKAVGMKDSDARRLVDYGAMVFNALGPDNALRRDAMANAGDIVPWITAACERERLEDNGLGASIYDAADGGEITHAEAGMLVRSFLSAGVDTTVTGIGNTLWCLANNPDAFDQLKASPKLVQSCFAEVLRYTSPVHTFCRTANADTEVSGQTIVEGAKILCVLGAANLDPEKWPEADRFKIDRKPLGHLAFGVGIHGCVGQNVARVELDAILSAIANKVDRIELNGEARWRPGNAIHSLDSMPLSFFKD